MYSYLNNADVFTAFIASIAVSAIGFVLFIAVYEMYGSKIARMSLKGKVWATILALLVFFWGGLGIYWLVL